MDGCLWLPEAAKLRRRMKGTKGGRKMSMWILNIEKEYFQTHTELVLKFILKEDINKKQGIEVFLVKYRRCVLICESEGAAGLGWFHDFGALEKTAMVSLSWPEPDVSPGESPGWETLTKLHQDICLNPCQCGFWIMEKCEELFLLIKTPPGFPKYGLGLWYWGGQRKGQKGRE